jgi:hypothetical protein
MALPLTFLRGIYFFYFNNDTKTSLRLVFHRQKSNNNSAPCITVVPAYTKRKIEMHSKYRPPISLKVYASDDNRLVRDIVVGNCMDVVITNEKLDCT